MSGYEISFSSFPSSFFSFFFLRQMCPFSQVHSILGPIKCCVVRQLNTYFGDFVNFLP